MVDGAWQGDVHGRGRVWCWGCAWCGCACQGVCMVGVCMAGGHAWQGACMVGGMCGKGAWVARDMCGRGVNKWAVHILLEYILVITFAES